MYSAESFNTNKGETRYLYDASEIERQGLGGEWHVVECSSSVRRSGVWIMFNLANPCINVIVIVRGKSHRHWRSAKIGLQRGKKKQNMIVNDVQSVRFTRRLGKDRKKRTERKRKWYWKLVSRSPLSRDRRPKDRDRTTYTICLQRQIWDCLSKFPLV